MKLELHVKGLETSCGPDPEEEFRARVLELLERIALALETGPHVPATMVLRVGPPEPETPSNG